MANETCWECGGTRETCVCAEFVECECEGDGVYVNASRCPVHRRKPYNPSPGFTLPPVDYLPCKLCGRVIPGGGMCEECREYVKVFR